MVKESSFLTQERIYHVPVYTIADTSRYLHIPLQTLRTWINGRSYPTRTGHKDFLPLIERPNLNIPQLSFTNLVEAHVLRVIRTVHNIPLDKVRLALDYISEQFKTEHPLVQKQFSTDGVDLFIEQVEQLINASRSGQLAMKQILNNLLTRIEWDEKDIAARLFPTLETNGESFADKALTIDPNVSFGKPTITGTGIPTKIVRELYDAGDSIEDIAADYNCQSWQIEKAILFESNLQAAWILNVPGNWSRQQMIDVFVNAIDKIEKIAQGNQAPFIAKVYRPARVILWKNRVALEKLLRDR